MTKYQLFLHRINGQGSSSWVFKPHNFSVKERVIQIDYIGRQRTCLQPPVLIDLTSKHLGCDYGTLARRFRSYIEHVVLKCKLAVTCSIIECERQISDCCAQRCVTDSIKLDRGKGVRAVIGSDG